MPYIFEVGNLRLNEANLVLDFGVVLSTNSHNKILPCTESEIKFGVDASIITTTSLKSNDFTHLRNSCERLKPMLALEMN